ncbi:hypothetical protein [Paenibacillus sp. QZ-Y1]|uniref:hypothetical protein n=1 Tax=Paenibacillus sp. QZ-Y1 TaxID=3414511 RepID=UPI003F7A27B8
MNNVIRFAEKLSEIDTLVGAMTSQEYEIVSNALYKRGIDFYTLQSLKNELRKTEFGEI